jgi:hypothetical protein
MIISKHLYMMNVNFQKTYENDCDMIIYNVNSHMRLKDFRDYVIIKRQIFEKPNKKSVITKTK